MSKVIPEIWIQAKKDTEWHRSQIQGFFHPNKCGTGLHLVRDCTQAPFDQLLWNQASDAAPSESYEKAHEESEQVIELAQTKLIAERYEELIAEQEAAQ